MDLAKDSNYNRIHPNETPCRWNANIYNCQDSDYYVILTGISLFLSFILIPLGIFLLYYSRCRWKKLMRPEKIDASISFYIVSIASGLSFTAYCLVLLLNPSGPYWPRYTLNDLGFVLIILGMVPYMSTLATPSSRGIPTIQGSMGGGTAIQVVPYVIPPLVLIHFIAFILRGVLLDKESPLGSDVATGVSQYSMGVVCFLISWTCWVHGMEFAMALRKSIQSIEGGLDPMSQSKEVSSDPYSTKVLNEENSTPFAFIRRVFSIRSFPSSTATLSPMAIRTTTTAYSSSSGTQSTPTISPTKTSTTIEAWAILKKVTFLNLGLAICNFIAGAVCILTGIMPSSIFTIPLLSKLIHLLFMVTMPIKIIFIMLCSLYAEYVRRKDRKAFLARSTSLAMQAIQVRQTILTGPPMGTDYTISSPGEREAGVEEGLERVVPPLPSNP